MHIQAAKEGRQSLAADRHPAVSRRSLSRKEVNNVLKAALERTGDLAPRSKMNQVNFSSLTKTVNIVGDRGPLGIHVVPYCSSLSGRTLGLHIKGIEEKSRSKRENIFQVDECIVKINDTALQDKTFTQSQEVFRQAMSSSVVNLEVLPVANKPRYEKSLIGQLFSADGKELKAKSPVLSRAKADFQLEPKVEMKKSESRPKTPDASPPPVELQPAHQRHERISPTPPARAASSSPSPKIRSESPPTRRSPVLPALANIANRKGGKRIKIDLKKGAEGLGFTVVTRDSSVHGPGPILVKNILQRGAAVKDGRLQPGDRILEVNGVDMTNRSQEELVAMLRSTKQGESVSVVVARQEDIFLPRELKGEETGSLLMEDGREQLMYEIPLNESGSAGLGVSLKGNKSRETGEDLGIFIKSIIHGGAAHKDGRLSVNDQLIAVNGESLLRRSNHAAMETLRRSMSSEGNARGTIQLVVLRAPRQPMGGTNPTATYQPNSTSSQQPKIQMVSNNQVLAGDSALQQQPPPPRRSSSLLPTLRRRATEPLPHGLRQRYAQRPGETHTRYTYRFNQKERRSGYTFGLAQRDADFQNSRDEEVFTRAGAREEEFVPHSRTPFSWNHHSNLNYTEHKHTHSRTLPDLQDRMLLDNSHRHSRTLEPDPRPGTNPYTENIRAMAGQMYPPTHSRVPHCSFTRYLDSQTLSYRQNRDLTRHLHLRLSGGL